MKIAGAEGEGGVRGLCDAVRVWVGTDGGVFAEIVAKEAFGFLEAAAADCFDDEDDDGDVVLSPYCSAGHIVDLICVCLQSRPQAIMTHVRCCAIYSSSCCSF